uniref:Uncharacterized protein n=1 Tax=Glossina brevipalpis TaxID=37001 RepID=A0A1A9WL54_9MUSC
MLKTLIRLNIGFFTLLSFVTAGFESHGISLNVLTNDTDIVNNNSIDNLTLPVHAKIHVIESTKRTHVSSTKSNGVELIRNDRSESSHRQNSESDLDEQFKESSKNFIIKIDNETIENLLETSTAHTTEKKAFDIGNLFSAKKAADDIEESTDIQLKSLHSPPDLSKASLNDFATPELDFSP